MLNVGVLGLGPRWRKRYAPALRVLSDRFRVRVICDAVQERADHEARQLGCSSAAGPTELLESADVQAVLLLDAAWYRLWPLELACRFGKPVLSAIPLDQDDEHVDALLDQVRERGLLVMLDLLPQLTPLAQYLRRLLAEQVGPAQVVLCDWAQRSGAEAGRLLGMAGGALLNFCAGLLSAAPSSVTAMAAPAAGLTNVLLEFPEGRAVQLVRRRVRGSGGLRLQIAAARGQVVAVPPRRIQWTDASGKHGHVLPRLRPPLQELLARFHQAVRTGQAAAPDLEEAARSLGWLRALARSQGEGRKVEVV
jgi:predicted dehydrogenase